MKTGNAGIAIIKRNEGCRLTAYQDITGTWTIGWGDTENVYEGLTITQQEADARLATRLSRDFEPAVNWVAAAVPTTQPQFDAMVSLAYNIGVGGFTNSSVARYHRDGEYTQAADAFRLWNHANGVVNKALSRRRAEERTLYLSALPAPVPVPPEPPPAVSDAQRLRDIAAELLTISTRM